MTIGPVRIEVIEPLHQLRGEIVAQKGQIVLGAAHLKEFVPSGQGRLPRGVHLVPALFNVHQDRIPQIIGVHGKTCAWIDHPGVQPRKLDHFIWHDAVIEMKQLRMPVAGPALINNFGIELGVEVVRFLTDDLQHIALPGFQGRVGNQEP